MRHVWSFLLAVVLAPTVWLLCGASEAVDLIDPAARPDGFHSLTGLALLLSAGSAYAILVLLPISPAGPTLAGLGYLGAGLWALAAPASYAGLWSSADVGRPGYGLALLLAVPLIGTALLMRRWEEPSPAAVPGPGSSEPARSSGAARPSAAARSSEVGLSKAARPSEAGLSEAGSSWLVPIRVPEADTAARRTAEERLPDNGDEATTTFATTPAEVTTALVMPPEAESTTILPTPTPTPTPREASPVPGGDEAKAPLPDVSPEPADDEATTLLPTPSPEVNPEPAGDEATTLLPDPSPEVNPEPAGDEATTLLPDPSGFDTDPDAEGGVRAEAERDTATLAEADSGAESEATILLPVDAGAAGDSVDEPTGVLPAGDQPAEPAAADLLGEQPTGVIPPLDDRPTGGLSSVASSGPGEKTQVISRDPGETTRIIRPREGIYPAPGSTTKAIKPRPAADKLNNPATADGQKADGQRTDGQKADGELTQAIRIPAVGLDPVPAPSIIEAERPDPGADPTTRLGAISTAGADTAAGEVTSGRPATVMSMERPPDEIEAEARALPRPRRPQDD